MGPQVFTDIPGGLEILDTIRKLDPENFYDYLDPDQLPDIRDCIKGDIVASFDGSKIGVLSRCIAGSKCTVESMIRSTPGGYRIDRDTLIDTFDRMASPQEVKTLREVWKNPDAPLDLPPWSDPIIEP